MKDNPQKAVIFADRVRGGRLTFLHMGQIPVTLHVTTSQQARELSRLMMQVAEIMDGTRVPADVHDDTLDQLEAFYNDNHPTVRL